LNTPGPIYEVQGMEKIKYKRPPSYTIGQKWGKKDECLLTLKTGTGLNLGPNAYLP